MFERVRLIKSEGAITENLKRGKCYRSKIQTVQKKDSLNFEKRVNLVAGSIKYVAGRIAV